MPSNSWCRMAILVAAHGRCTIVHIPVLLHVKCPLPPVLLVYLFEFTEPAEGPHVVLSASHWPPSARKGRRRAPLLPIVVFQLPRFLHVTNLDLAHRQTGLPLRQRFWSRVARSIVSRRLVITVDDGSVKAIIHIRRVVVPGTRDYPHEEIIPNLKGGIVAREKSLVKIVARGRSGGGRACGEGRSGRRSSNCGILPVGYRFVIGFGWLVQRRG